jgi:DNA polymerase elongation subunit (family B)
MMKWFQVFLSNSTRAVTTRLLWTNPDKYDKMDTKGIETVRRDNCLLAGAYTRPHLCST